MNKFIQVADFKFLNIDDIASITFTPLLRDSENIRCSRCYIKVRDGNYDRNCIVEEEVYATRIYNQLNNNEEL